MKIKAKKLAWGVCPKRLGWNSKCGRFRITRHRLADNGRRRGKLFYKIDDTTTRWAGPGRVETATEAKRICGLIAGADIHLTALGDGLGIGVTTPVTSEDFQFVYARDEWQRVMHLGLYLTPAGRRKSPQTSPARQADLWLTINGNG